MSTAVLRDTAAWYHIQIVANTTTLTVYVNGVQFCQVAISGGSQVNQSGLGHEMCQDVQTSGESFDGYLADVHFVDGQALGPTTFGSFHQRTGQWRPKAYSGTYGTNGFHLDFSDGSAATSGALGKDRSGNNNDWTPANISVTAGATQDWLLDSPTNNYATLSSIASAGVTISAGGLDFTTSLATTPQNGFGTVPMRSGKWQFEVQPTAISSDNSAVFIGICGTTSNTVEFYSQPSGYAYRGSAQKSNNGSIVGYGSALALNDIVGGVFDADAGTLEFFLNGVPMGVAYSAIPAGDYVVAVADSGSTVNWGGNLNCGQRPFAYPVAGARGIGTKNLPIDPGIIQPKKHFDVALYTGNSGVKTISGVQFQPDFVWAKCRDVGQSHGWFDAVRGATNYLVSNTTGAEAADAGSLTSFNADGFTLGASGPWNNLNQFVSWMWKAGGAPAANNAGSIASQVSANPAAGFSIVSYTGTGANGTVGHGLGSAPKMVIVKTRNGGVYNWHVFHSKLTDATYYLRLSTNNAQASDASVWNSAAPNSSVVSVGAFAAVNENAANFIAYCFAEVPGFSKFGSYVGNGSTDGPFVHCGFRPRWVMAKYVSGGSVADWMIIDTERDISNVMDSALRANTAGVEDASNPRIDATANGFKVRAGAAVEPNQSGATYIFAAFAEFPLRYANAR